MTIQSSSCIVNSLPEADRVVGQLRAAEISAEEISVLLPAKQPESNFEPTPRTGDSEPRVRVCEQTGILVSVHLEGGCGMGRAEEIFGRAGSGTSRGGLVEDESPRSWVKPFLR